MIFPIFQDVTGRRWLLLMDPAKLPAALGFAIEQPEHIGLLQQFVHAALRGTDSRQVMNMAWLLCHDAAERRGLDREAFAELIGDSTLPELLLALWAVLDSYFARRWGMGVALVSAKGDGRLYPEIIC